jgi:hypothetical protein
MIDFERGGGAAHQSQNPSRIVARKRVELLRRSEAPISTYPHAELAQRVGYLLLGEVFYCWLSVRNVALDLLGLPPPAHQREPAVPALRDRALVSQRWSICPSSSGCLGATSWSGVDLFVLAARSQSGSK